MTRLLTITLFLFPFALFAADWGGEELAESADAAYTDFEKDHPKFFDSITSLVLTMNDDKAGAKAVVTYVDGDKKSKTATFEYPEDEKDADTEDDHGHPAAVWGGDELAESTEYAFNAFKNGKSTAGYFNSIVKCEVTMKSSKKAAQVVFTYLDKKSKKVTKRYFCHTHGNHIDCH